MVGNDFAYDGIQTSDGGYLMVGYEYGGFAVGKAIKIDSAGNVLHSAYLGGGFSNSVMHTCIEKYPGKYLIAGKNYINNYDAYVAVLDTAFNLLDDATYPLGVTTTLADVAYKALPFQDGYLIELASFSGTGSRIMWLFDNLDTLRVMDIPLSYQLVSSNINTKYFDMCVTSDNKFAFATTGYDLAFNRQVLILKTDTLMNVEWDHYYGSANLEQGSSIAQTYDNGFVVCGIYMYTQNIGQATDDYYIIILLKLIAWAIRM